MNRFTRIFKALCRHWPGTHIRLPKSDIRGPRYDLTRYHLRNSRLATISSLSTFHYYPTGTFDTTTVRRRAWRLLQRSARFLYSHGRSRASHHTTSRYALSPFSFALSFWSPDIGQRMVLTLTSSPSRTRSLLLPYTSYLLPVMSTARPRTRTHGNQALTQQSWEPKPLVSPRRAQWRQPGAELGTPSPGTQRSNINRHNLATRARIDEHSSG